MNYRQIGHSGLKVSEIGLGSWLTHGTTIDQSASTRIIHEAYEKGVNFFDTANLYGYGEAEIILGEALQDIPRHSVVVTSKVFFPMSEEINHRGLSRKHIMEECNATLKRLKIDYLDLYLCHRYDTTVPVEETARAMDDLIRQGKVLYFGVSKWGVSQMEELRKICDKYLLHRFICNQHRYNLLDQEIEPDILSYCEQERIGQLIYSPLAQGVLTGKYRLNQPMPEKSRATNKVTAQWLDKLLNNKNLEIVEQLIAIAKKEEMSLTHLSLAWLLRKSSISSCIIGATNTQQLNHNLEASGRVLSNAVIQEIENIFRENSVL